MAAQTFDLDREVQRALNELAHKQRIADRAEVETFPEPERKAIRAALRAKHEQDRDKTLAAAYLIVREREAQFARAAEYRDHRRLTRARWEDRWKAERAERVALKAEEQAEEARRNADLLAHRATALRRA